MMILMIPPANRLDLMCDTLLAKKWPLGLLDHLPDIPIKNKLRSFVVMNFDFKDEESHLNVNRDPKNPTEGLRSCYT